jgi:hypothetical protein
VITHPALCAYRRSAFPGSLWPAQTSSIFAEGSRGRPRNRACERIRRRSWCGRSPIAPSSPARIRLRSRSGAWKCASPGHISIVSYSAFCQPVTMLIPNRPGAIESIVAAARAAIAGGIARIGGGAKQLDPPGPGEQPGDQREGIQTAIPVAAGAAKAMQLRHRQTKIETGGLRLRDDFDTPCRSSVRSPAPSWTP